MNETTVKGIFINPIDRKKIDAIIKATCTAMDITKEVLLSGTDYEIVAIRHQMLYLISFNTNMNDNKLAKEFNLSRFAVQYATDKIKAHKKVYADVTKNLKLFADTANNCLEEKLIVWE